MDENELLKQAGLSPSWLHEFVVESNKIDPQQGSAEPGTVLYDAHRDAVLYAIRMASEDRYALPKAIHEMLLKDHPLAGVLRAHKVKIAGVNLLDHVLVPRFMWRWNRVMHTTIDSLRTDDNSIDPDDKIARVWEMHIEFENIRPYELYNGKVGRVLMVNHALLVDVNPWIIPSEDGREDYFDLIRQHPSAKWGSLPTAVYNEDFSDYLA